MSRYKSSLSRDWTFANVRLTADQREEFILWATQQEAEGEEIVASLINDEVKISISRDIENETWIVSLTGLKDAARNAKTTMSARHNDLHQCILLIAFKHLVVCKDTDWSSYAGTDEWG